jgi:predicted HNH restriction endonuclease
LLNDDGVYTEGQRLTTHERAERSPKVRARALAIHGTACSICGFSFAEADGPLGTGFAEVHHLVPPQDAAPAQPAIDPEVLKAMLGM